ncbi:hypothetical protein C8J56DRAFT_781964, partial [Mycena floridula]
FVDKTNTVVMVFEAAPTGNNYLGSATQAFEKIMRLGDSHDFLAQQCEHRRGAFPALNFGINHGGGPPAPYRLGQRAADEGVIEALLTDPDIQRLAIHQSASFQLWFPDLYEYYQQHTSILFEHHPELKPNWPRSIYACCTVNFGGRVRCFRHRDPNNLAFGMCAVTALGKFNHKKGGHLVFDELKLVVEFPHGTTCWIPSASLTHSNIPVTEGEQRVSLTQYSAGPIFRYIHNGFRTQDALKVEDPALYALNMEENKTRWKMGLALLPTIDKYIEM